jgi:SAM-dependent methyltransferase
MNEFRTDGYFSDDGYVHGYYRELSPVFQRFCLLLRGLACDDFGADSSHCELGFGQGDSVAIHAAANPGQYIATDFNPAHAAHTRAIVRSAGCNARIYDDSFAQLLERTEMPAFDSIGLHGVWSWVDRANHQVIVDFVSRHLKPGGIFYVSYNCFPGWSPVYPLRHILAQHDRYAAQRSGAVQRVESALHFAETLLAAEPLTAAAMPVLAGRLALTKTLPPNYVAHEFLNRAWHCLYFSDMAETLADAKLDFAGTAQPLDVVDSATLTPAAIAFLKTIEHPTLREQMRDYFVNRKFRKDLYVRGARALAPAERREAELATRIVLEKTAEAIPNVIDGPCGQVTLYEPLFGTLKQVLESRGYVPKPLAELLRALPQFALSQLVSACALLVGAGYATPCHAEPVVRQVSATCAALNVHLLERARTHDDIQSLASPVTGGGASVSRFQQLFLLARGHGSNRPQEWARFAWDILAAQGQAVVKDGNALTGPEESLAELAAQANAFAAERLPVLIAQGVA